MNSRPSLAGRVLCALGLWLLLACTALAAPRVGVVTMQPGAEYWSRFGHNAILIDRQDGSDPTLYNYGYFDFDEPGFLLRFLHGQMEYRLLAIPLREDLAYYTDEGRGVRLQWLALTNAQAHQLAEFLAWNARPENSRYRYDYFTRNCSTMVRDALDAAMDGHLKPQLFGRSRGLSYRSEALRLGEPELWLYLGMSAGLGPFADTALSRWTEGFVPGRLAEALREATTADGSPLVIDEQELVPARLADPPYAPPYWRWRFIGAGLALAALFAYGLGRQRPAALRIASGSLLGLLWLGAGLGGLLLVWLWGFSEHVAAWQNENALLFNPLCLGLLVALPALWRGRPTSRWLNRLALIIALCAGLAMFLKFLPFRIQSNGDWIGFWLPIHAVVTWRMARNQKANSVEVL